MPDSGGGGGQHTSKGLDKMRLWSYFETCWRDNVLSKEQKDERNSPAFRTDFN